MIAFAAHAVTRYRFMTALLLVLSCMLVLVGVSVGSTGIKTLADVFSDPISGQIVWTIRLPRSMGALLAGALLGMTGAIAQGLFRNPLADPYLLGSASGASLAVALSLAFYGSSPFTGYLLNRLGLTGAAFIGAMGAVLLTLVLAKGVQNTLRLLLSGVVIGVIGSALSSIVALRSPDSLQSMQAFLLGSTGFISWAACAVMAMALLFSLLMATLLSKVLDGLTLGETTAASLGLNLTLMRGALIVVMSLTTGAAVAQVGLVAFVGLVAPHLVRSLLRVNHAKLIMLSALMGGILLLAADILARALIAPQELPVGVLTAVLGGGYLCWLMYTGRQKNEFHS